MPATGVPRIGIRAGTQGRRQKIAEKGDFQGGKGGVLEGEPFLSGSVSWVGGKSGHRGAVVSDEGLFRGEGAGGAVREYTDSSQSR